jgi:hypothetical protein
MEEYKDVEDEFEVGRFSTREEERTKSVLFSLSRRCAMVGRHICAWASKTYESGDERESKRGDRGEWEKRKRRTENKTERRPPPLYHP